MIAVAFTSVFAQANEKNNKDLMSAPTFEGLKMRNIGPALMSGRIADIAIHPENPNLWYVAVGSGGVWKTVNSGTTWEPIFDDQSSYSIGCVTIDPHNPKRIWVGTGENIGGRHVGYGDGIYLSEDGGQSWENMGLKESQHISKIIVHPENPRTLWVAAQGPLWSSGGQRGLFKTTDGGKNWNNVLNPDEWTGVTDVAIDPRNPDRLYAATWQRHRTEAIYMGGGPGSGIYRSEDGGQNWKKLTKGLPDKDMGKIGLAISPQKPDVVYAAIETERRKGGIWRSDDRGAHWEKRSDKVSGGTGPHYYQELYASPHQFDKIYLADVVLEVSDNGGKTFSRINSDNIHVDHHALAFRRDEPGYRLLGSDGGLYESFDEGNTWRFIDNLPVTQFYKIALDDKKPFYNIYGGTQDNNTQGGPSRTDNVNGIRNCDWFITLFADGHQPATEPGNPDIVYSEWQQGNLMRIDRTTGEKVYIRPQPEADDPPQRFNWDAPIEVSPHKPTRLYYASQRVWRSENRGDSWQPISDDLTRNEDRLKFQSMGRPWSWDAAWDMLAMSNYNTITQLDESPLQEGLIYAGTDDGFIQVTEDGGESWRRVKVSSFPGIDDDRAFVNDIKADLHDANTAYAVIDLHKSGDFRPLIYKSTDRGNSWKKISEDLPERHIAWRIIQDHVNKNLLFAATEFGIFFTVDGGENWTELTASAPNIAFRDLSIQRRENDLVGASFGRGIWILDDYTPLRQVTQEELEQEALLFDSRKAWWYIQQTPLGSGGKASQGDSYYTAPNPPYGAVFTYYLKESLKTREQMRREKEEQMAEKGEYQTYPGWDTLHKEQTEPEPKILLTVKDQQGEVVRRISGPTEKGFHRVSWNLSYPPVELSDAPDRSSLDEAQGPRVAPGTFEVTLSKQVRGETTRLAGPVKFEVERMREGAIEGKNPEETARFWRRSAELQRSVNAAGEVVDMLKEQVKKLKKALASSQSTPDGLDQELHEIRQTVYDLDVELNGHPAREPVNEPAKPTVRDRLGAAQMGTQMSTYGPTPNHKKTLRIAEEEFAKLRKELSQLKEERIPALQEKLIEAGAPWTPGQEIPDVK
ncbi:MAG: VPS10 domain-containing protein [bacterium]